MKLQSNAARSYCTRPDQQDATVLTMLPGSRGKDVLELWWHNSLASICP